MQKVLRYGPWGYNMTLNNFYKVIKETPRTAIVREIGSKCIEISGYLSGYEIPDENEKNINFKEYRVIKRADGTYRGKCGLSRTYDLDEVKFGDKFYFNHCD
jgi:hypothetical protein